MADIFLKAVNMSISASWLVLAVLLLRLALKKAPKWIMVFLWGIVAVRLVCPFSIESVVSLIPSAETISPEIAIDAVPQIDTGVPVFNEIVNPMIGESFAPAPTASANPLQILIPIAAHIWVVGIGAMLLYSVVSYFRLRKRITTAVLLRENMYQSERVISPFVLGLIQPKIYLPFYMPQQEMDYVISHEQAHIRRADHIWKPLGFLLLSVHWFNPLVWLSYVLLCRDIEFACDEKVVKGLSAPQQADYAQALLDCSVNRRAFGACPLAFGETGVKGRIQSVLHYKKPAFWLVLVAVLAGIATGVCFLTDPIDLNKDDVLLRVLQNKKPFVGPTGETVFLRDYKLGGGANVETLPQKYTLVDMDRDGTRELVVYASPQYGAYLVFHADGSKVYGFEFAEKDMTQLKEDGTFVQTRASGISQYTTMHFDKNKVTLVEQAYKQDALQNYDNNVYRIDGETVTFDRMYAYTKDFAGRSYVRWTAMEGSESGDAISMYMSFLAGRATALESNILVQSLDAYVGKNATMGTFSYTFYDITGDGVPELGLRVHATGSKYFFTVKSGRLHLWYAITGDNSATFLNNGAFMTKVGSLTDGYTICNYYELDPDANIKFRVTFAWHDQNGNQREDEKDIYRVNGEEASREVYDQTVERYGDISSSDIYWAYMGKTYQEPTLG